MTSDQHHSYTTPEEIFPIKKASTSRVKNDWSTHDEILNLDISNLVDNQRRIFLRVVKHYRNKLLGENLPPLRINIDGTAGIGKSYLIDALTKALIEIAGKRILLLSQHH